MKRAGWSSILVAVVLLALAVIAEAQEPKKVPSVGFLLQRVGPTPTTPDPFADAFRQGLRDLGYIEGKNILVEYRYGEGKWDWIPSQVAELVQLKVCLSLDLYQRSARPSRRPRRFP
jgi:putative ABC transport system substrate-binding protein